MSIKLLTRPNSNRLFVLTDKEYGINLNDTKIKSSSENDNYTYVLPEKPLVQNQPLVQVSTLNGDVVDTTWVSASGGVIPIPPILTIDKLISNNIENAVEIQTNTLVTEEITNNTFIDTNSIVTNATFFKSLSNPTQSTTITFNGDGGTNIAYVLPDSSISEGQTHVMVANRTGVFTRLELVNPVENPSQLLPRTYVWTYESIDQIFESGIHPLISNKSCVLALDSYYKVTLFLTGGVNGIGSAAQVTTLLVLQNSSAQVTQVVSPVTTFQDSSDERICQPYVYYVETPGVGDTNFTSSISISLNRSYRFRKAVLEIEPINYFTS